MASEIKVKWMKEGDCNSMLFCGIATGRRMQGYIKDIELDDGLLTKDHGVIVDKIPRFNDTSYTDEYLYRPMIKV